MSQDESNTEPNGRRTLTKFQSLFVLVGIALIVAGLNTERSLVIVGAVLIGLAVFSSRRTGRKQVVEPVETSYLMPES